MVVCLGGCDVEVNRFLAQVRSAAEKAGVFASARVAEGRLECRAQGCASESFYRIEQADGKWWVGFVTPDRWLSESIEADLEHTGDELDDLLEEELAELGLDAALPYQHYRSEARLFTFRSPLPIDEGLDEGRAADVALKCLLAYEASFRELGDVAGAKEEN